MSRRGRALQADPVVDLCAAVAKARFSDLSDAVIEHTKRRLLDNIGVALAGHRSTECRKLESWLVDQSTGSESRVLGTGERGSALNTAFANSIKARSYDFCDVCVPGYHPSSTDVPAALAVGEAIGASSKDMVLALAVGQDLAMRINKAGWGEGGLHGFDGNVLAVFGATAVAGKLLELSRDELVHAVGFALNFACGSTQSNQDKTLSVRINQGIATRNGIEAAFFSQLGMTAPSRSLTGSAGFFSLFPRRPPDLSVLSEGLGESFLGPEITAFKYYPVCSLLLSVVDAVLSMGFRAGARPSAVRRVIANVSGSQYRLCGQAFSPGVNAEVDAMFSVGYAIATTLLRGRPHLDHFVREQVLEKSVRDTAAMVEIVPCNDFALDECEVTIELDDGTKRSAHAQLGKGWPGNALTDAELRQKFGDCLAFSNLDWAVEREPDILNFVADMEGTSQVSELVDLIVP